jgi:hypothetical protein
MPTIAARTPAVSMMAQDCSGCSRFALDEPITCLADKRLLMPWWVQLRVGNVLRSGHVCAVTTNWGCQVFCV